MAVKGWVMLEVEEHEGIKYIVLPTELDTREGQQVKVTL